MILREDNKTGMDVWINSFGGCASNFLSYKLESVGLKTRTNEWKDTYCHYPYPKDLGIPIVYLYRDMLYVDIQYSYVIYIYIYYK